MYLRWLTLIIFGQNEQKATWGWMDHIPLSGCPLNKPLLQEDIHPIDVEENFLVVFIFNYFLFQTFALNFTCFDNIFLPSRTASASTAMSICISFYEWTMKPMATSIEWIAWTFTGFRHFCPFIHNKFSFVWTNCWNNKFEFIQI